MAILVGYWPALRAGFIYDDRFFVVENNSIRSWHEIHRHFIDPKTTTASIPWNPIWRPMRNVTYALDYQIWGLDPRGYHVTNLLVHYVNAILVSSIIRLLLPEGWAFLLGSLIFALHPVQTEAVVWISGRDDLLVGLFLLIAWRLFIQYRIANKRYYQGLSLISYILALLSKETAMALTLTLPFSDILLLSRKEGKRLSIVDYIPYIALGLIYFFLRLSLLGRLAHRPYWGGTFLSNLLTMLWVLAQYIRLVVCPLWLRADYVIPPVVDLADWRWILGLALFLGMSILAWRCRSWKWTMFAWGWFLIFLLPVSNIIPIAAIMAERFLYMPMVGFSILIGWFLGQLPNRPLWVLASVLVLMMMVLTARRATEWQEPGRFWRTEVVRSPSSAIAHNNLGQYYYRQGNLDSAMTYFTRAVDLNPSLAVAHASLGDVYYHRGEYQKALESYQKYLQLKPDAPNHSQAERRIQRLKTLLGSNDAKEE